MKRIDKAIHAYMMASKKVPASETKPGEAKPKRRSARGLMRPGQGVKRAAKLLMLLDQESASEILAHLNEQEVERITKEIADTGKIDRNEAHQILDDFHVKKQKVAPVSGGTAVAKEMLVHSFGSEAGMRLYRRAVPIEIDNPFGFLDDLDFQQVLMLLKKEPAPVISVILPYMAARTASQVLEALPPELQMNVVKRVARLQKISPDALMKVAEALREKIRKQGRLVTEEVDGPLVLAEILENMSSDAEREILDHLDAYNPELAIHIRDRLYTIDVVFALRAQDLQAVLREFTEEEIAVVLKGKRPAVRQRILDAVSERRRTIITEEIDRLGAMSRRDVDKATREFVTYIRDLAENGKIAISRKRGDQDPVV